MQCFSTTEVSTHSRPKAAGTGATCQTGSDNNSKFQHTAARRRLGHRLFADDLAVSVSTHSRPKAAGPTTWICRVSSICFNTQPPEGGWGRRVIQRLHPYTLFQHTAARRRLGPILSEVSATVRFQHTAARRRLVPRWKTKSNISSCFNTQPPEGGWGSFAAAISSRARFQHTAARRRLGH